MTDTILLKDFVHNSKPILCEDFCGQPSCRIADSYIDAAQVAYDNAERALTYGDAKTAYWNALHAICSYAAAHIAASKPNTPEAVAAATATYMDAVNDTRATTRRLDALYR